MISLTQYLRGAYRLQRDGKITEFPGIFTGVDNYRPKNPLTFQLTIQYENRGKNFQQYFLFFLLLLKK
jgi:hypothetical protein